MNVRAIRDTLRHEASPSLRRRRRIGALAAVGLADFSIIALYQMGFVRRLPDLPGRIFDSNRVNASTKAYATGIPDGATGTLLYSGLLTLAAAGGTERTGRSPWLDATLGGVALAGVAGAANYLWDMARRQQRACPYCLLGAGLNVAIAAYAAPDAARSIKKLTS